MQPHEIAASGRLDSVLPCFEQHGGGAVPSRQGARAYWKKSYPYDAIDCHLTSNGFGHVDGIVAHVIRNDQVLHNKQ